MENERNGEYKISSDQIASSKLNDKRTDSIGLWKVLCTYMIVILHFGGAIGWKLAVEFFFIASGLLAAYDFDVKKAGYWQYIRKRILRLYPHYIYSFVIFIAVSAIISGGGVELCS